MKILNIRLIYVKYIMFIMVKQYFLLYGSLKLLLYIR